MNEYENHPASALFPIMSPTDLKELADDIEKNGLREPIQLFDGKILDGRNRYLACKMRKIKPVFSILNGDCSSPVAFVASKNLFRRHLSVTQRSAIAVDVQEGLRDESHKRQLSHLKHQANQSVASLGPIGPDDKERSVTTAARLMKVGETSIKRAARVKRDAPELFEQMKQGKSTIEAARRETAKRAGGKKRFPSMSADKRIQGVLDSLEIKARAIGEFLQEKEAKQHPDSEEWFKRLRKVRLCLSQTINRGGNSDGK